MRSGFSFFANSTPTRPFSAGSGLNLSNRRTVVRLRRISGSSSITRIFRFICMSVSVQPPGIIVNGTKDPFAATGPFWSQASGPWPVGRFFFRRGGSTRMAQTSALRSRLEKSATAKSTAKNRLNSGAGKDRGKVAQEVRAGFCAKRFSSWQTEAEVPMITILTIIIV